VCVCVQIRLTSLVVRGLSTSASRSSRSRCRVVPKATPRRSLPGARYTRITHTRLTALCPGLPGWAGTRKAKPIWILLKQETVSRSGISWAICKSAPRSRQTTAHQHLTAQFFTGRMPFLSPNQQRQSTEGTYTTDTRNARSQLNIATVTYCRTTNELYRVGQKTGPQTHDHSSVKC